MSVKASFDLSGRVAMITGGAGLLGVKHAEAIAEMGGISVLLDLDTRRAKTCANQIAETFGVPSLALTTDITRPGAIADALSTTLATFGRVDILINNAANNPKVGEAGLVEEHWSRLETFPLEIWRKDLEVGLTGAFLCSQIIGSEMARRGRGVILNIASDLAIIAPDQRLYRRPDVPEEQQPVKPISYVVAKAGLLGLTRYLATYWALRGVRVNALSPGGVYSEQSAEFVQRVSNLIPMGRMAYVDEYKSAVVFLVSDASSFMTGANVVIDGGRTSW